MRTVAICGAFAVLLIAGLGTPACGSDSGESAGAGGTEVGGASATGGADGGGTGGGSATGGFGGGFLTDATNPDTGACDSVSKQADIIPPIIELVIDTSGSMLEDAPGGGTKWDVTEVALEQAINGTPGMPDVGAVGINYYPNVPTSAGGPCIQNQVAVGIAPLDATHRTAITDSLAAQNPKGATPTHDAYVFGLQALVATTQQGSRVIVLMTDGAATNGISCSDTVDNTSLIAQVASATNAGVRTFVVGSPGSEAFRDVLSQMATAGGTAKPGCSDTGPTYCHFDMTTSSNLAADLAQALTDITGQALSCEFDVPEPPPGKEFAEDKVNVVFTDGSGTETDIFKDGSGGCTKGWVFSPDRTKVILCGADCDMVKADPQGKIDILFGCDTKVQ